MLSSEFAPHVPHSYIVFYYMNRYLHICVNFAVLIENGMVESNTELKYVSMTVMCYQFNNFLSYRRVVTGNGDEYTVPQSS